QEVESTAFGGGWSTTACVRSAPGRPSSGAMEPLLAEALPSLAEAARTIGGPQIRNRGTIGGNLGTASPAGDALPPLLIGDAVVETASLHGERALPLGGVLTGPKRHALAQDGPIVGGRGRPQARPHTVKKN